MPPIVFLLASLVASAAATRCDSWCNAFTCSLSNSCTGCSVCAELDRGAYCASWCNPYSTRLQHCHGCGKDKALDKIIYIIRHGEKSGRDKLDDFGGNLTRFYQESNPRPQPLSCLSEKGWARAYNMKSVFGANPRDPGSATQEAARSADALFSCDYADFGIDCKDRDNGFYRTQQTISPLMLPRAVGGLGLPIDSSLGFMPQLCAQAYPQAALVKKPAAFSKFPMPNVGEARPGFAPAFSRAEPTGECNPYGKTFQEGTGMCCNQAAADVIKAKLMEPGINTILVAWEHVNIQWLALALGAPHDKVIDEGCVAAGTAGAAEDYECWPGVDYDLVYALHYDQQGAFLPEESSYGPTNPNAAGKYLTQGFDAPAIGGEWLGPMDTCGESEEAVVAV